MKYLLLILLIAGTAQAQTLVMSAESPHYGLGVGYDVGDYLTSQALFKFGQDIRGSAIGYFMPFKIEENFMHNRSVSPIVFGEASYSFTRKEVFRYGGGIRFNWSERVHFDAVLDLDFNPVFSFSLY